MRGRERVERARSENRVGSRVIFSSGAAAHTIADVTTSVIDDTQAGRRPKRGHAARFALASREAD